MINPLIFEFQLVALSLRCICTFLRAPLPSIEEYAPKMSTAIFTLLHKYAGNTASENVEMVQTAFKVNICLATG